MRVIKLLGIIKLYLKINKGVCVIDNASQSQILSFPHDMLKEILVFATKETTDLSSCRRVCQAWHQFGGVKMKTCLRV